MPSAPLQLDVFLPDFFSPQTITTNATGTATGAHGRTIVCTPPPNNLLNRAQLPNWRTWNLVAATRFQPLPLDEEVASADGTPRVDVWVSDCGVLS